MTDSGFNEDDFDLDLTNVDPEKLDDYAKPLPGKYHVLVQKVELNKKFDQESGEEKKNLSFDYEILAGTVAGQEGRTNREFLTFKLPKRLTMFALASGLVTLQQLQEAKANGVNPKINWKAAEGQTLCLEVEHKKEDKYPRVAFSGMWHVSDEAAKDIPKNPGYLGGSDQVEDDPFGGLDSEAA